ncbi:hypothetical protein ACFV16_33815 [Streptomyces massasporeus]|uniref:hypothetical protein n=1 Tax=Streptomyces massasporeus TaxID=67324 RepID=UPI003684100E
MLTWAVLYNPYEALGMWEDAFDAVILSEREGMRKPSAFNDHRALDALGLSWLLERASAA